MVYSDVKHSNTAPGSCWGGVPCARASGAFSQPRKAAATRANWRCWLSTCSAATASACAAAQPATAICQLERRMQTSFFLAGWVSGPEEVWCVCSETSVCAGCWARHTVLKCFEVLCFDDVSMVVTTLLRFRSDNLQWSIQTECNAVENDFQCMVLEGVACKHVGADPGMRLPRSCWMHAPSAPRGTALYVLLLPKLWDCNSFGHI